MKMKLSFAKPPGGQLAWVLTPGSRWRLRLAVALSILLSVLEIASFAQIMPLTQVLSGTSPSRSLLLRWYVDLTGTSNSRQLMAWICAVMVVTFLLKGLLGLAVRWWILGFIFAEEGKLAKELASYYAMERYEFHLANPSAVLLRNLNEAVSHVFVFGLVGLVGVLGELSFAGVVVASLLFLAPAPMLAFVAFLSIATVGVLFFTQTHAKRAGRDLVEASAEIYRHGEDIVGGYRDMRLNLATGPLITRYMAARLSSTSAHRRAGFTQEAPRYVLEMIFIVGLAGFAALIVASTSTKDALPLLTYVVIIGFRLVPTLSRMLSFSSLVRLGLPALDAVRPHLESARNISTPANPSAPNTSAHFGRNYYQGDLTITGVSYRYPSADRNAITDINMRIPFGTSVAIVGKSGSGKSTIADLVCGLLSPTEGRIQANGIDIEVDVESWRSVLGVVSQSTYVFDATIIENVALGIADKDVDRSRMSSAISAAGLDDVVDALPLGLNSPIGEGGSALSGGQRQRLGLARALYHEPLFVLLDEATSALDNITEAHITKSLLELRGRASTLIIAHRLSTVQRCDQIILITDGVIQEVGTFSELCARSPEFSEMVRLGELDTAS